MKKLTLLVAGGRRLRARHPRRPRALRTDQEGATRVKDDPRVQEKAHQAADLAKEKAPVVKDKVASAASTAADKVTPSGSGDTAPTSRTSCNPDNTARQDDPYPQGNLP